VSEQPNEHEYAASEYSEWIYYVVLDGDYAQECRTEAEAQKVRREARGHVAVKDRKMWRERIESQDVAPRSLLGGAA